MAGPELKDGHTRVAHEIMEDIGQYGLNGTQFAIVVQVWRYTYGFNRKKAKLSLSFLATALKKAKNHIDRELNALITRNVIHVSFDPEDPGRYLEFNKYFGTWLPRPRRDRRSKPKTVQAPIEPLAVKKTRKPKEYALDNTYFKMADYFLKRVQKVAADEGLEHLTIKANLQSWANDFRLLVESDNVEDRYLIRDVMDWVTEDEFWRRNILSAKKLREKFCELAIKMRAGSKPKRPNQRTDKEADARQTQIRRDEALRKWMDDGNDPDDFRFDG